MGLLSLLDRAVVATARSFTIADVRLPDHPLVYANPAFERMTGYRRKAVLGSNCRFLQGPGTDPTAVDEMRDAIRSGTPCSVTVLNYRADGSAFWNEVSLSPIAGADGAMTHVVGVQDDVTARVLAELGREQAHAQERETRSLLESVLATVPVGLGFWDLDGRFTSVNRALAEINGVPIEDHLGRRVDQVLDGDLTQVGDHVQTVIATGRPVLDQWVTGEVDDCPGELQHWLTSYYPVRDPDGALVSVGAVVSVVTAQRRAEADRSDALERERRARVAAEAAHERLGLLTRSMEVLTASLDLDASLARFADLLVPRPADWVAIHLVDDDGRAARAVLCHRDHERADRLAALHRPGDLPQPVADVLASGRPRLLTKEPEDLLTPSGASAGARRDLGLHSAVVVPLPARGRTIGTLSLARAETPEPLGPDDLSLALELATRVALAVDNQRLYARDHEVAVTLQQALLPDHLPEVDGIELCVRYVAGAVGVDVGGDWYDAFPLDGDRIALTIGDVVGHDLEAAVKMGELRTTLRAYAADGRGPADVVTRLDHLAGQHRQGFLATLVYGELEPATGRFTYTRAGHLPPVMIDAEGDVRVVDDRPSPPVGLGSRHHQHTLVLAPGSTIALYTDGLVERRGEDIDRGLERLLQAAAGTTDDPELLCDRLLSALSNPAEMADDIALLTVRRQGPAPPAPPPSAP